MFKIHINDRVLVSVLFIVMAVFSSITITNLRETNDQTAKLRQAVTTEQVLSEVGIVCTLDTSGAVNTGAIPYTSEAIEKYVNECIVKEAAQRNIKLSDGASPATVPTTVTTQAP